MTDDPFHASLSTGEQEAVAHECTHDPNTCDMVFCDWPSCNQPSETRAVEQEESLGTCDTLATNHVGLHARKLEPNALEPFDWCLNWRAGEQEGRTAESDMRTKLALAVAKGKGVNLSQKYAKALYCLIETLERAPGFAPVQTGEGSTTMPTLDENQCKLVQWGTTCFGAEHMADPKVRALRLLEEAIELAQSVGVESPQCSELVQYVYSRPPGNPKQELGGIGVTWLVAANAFGESAAEMLENEITRIHQKDPSHFAQRNQDKCKAGFDSSKVRGGSTGPDTPKKGWLKRQFDNLDRKPFMCMRCNTTFGHEGHVCEGTAVSVRGEGVAPTLSDRINALPEWARQHIHDIETKCDPAGDIRTIGELRDNVAALAAEIEELRKEHIEWRVPDPALCDNQHNHPKLCHCLDPLYWKGRAEELLTRTLKKEDGK